jgi:hypothetical protein
MNIKAINARLEKSYGITLDEYNQLLKSQDGVCAICKRPPKKNMLSVDHDHKFNKIKGFVAKYGVKYEAIPTGKFWEFIKLTPNKGIIGATRKEALEKFRAFFKRRSIRGLLCMRCNRSLQMMCDDPVRLRRAADYLELFNLSVKRTDTIQ